MSQDLRDYRLYRVDENIREAREMGVTATVGPTGHGKIDARRGVQITLRAPSGIVYARVSEPQIRDLIEVLEKRLDPDDVLKAIGGEADRETVSPSGTTLEEPET